MAREFETKSELVRMALVYAIQDRESMLDCLHVSDEYRPQVLRELKEFRRYLKARFEVVTGRHMYAQDVADGRVALVSLAEIRAPTPQAGEAE